MPIVKWSWAVNGSMSVAALLLPLMVAADSQIQTSAANAASVATAHVNFKIIIPKVLSLRIGSGSTAGAETVAIMSNGRNVSLNATLRTAEPDVHAPGRVVLGAAGRKVIAQDALCVAGDGHATPTPATARRVKVDDRQVVCTVSMP
jgi:hypothetical protein